MSLIAIGNIIFIVALVCVGLSIFWSSWTFKLFKPHLWLERKKTKLLHAQIERIERRSKDKNRFYIFWFLIEQIDSNMIDGAIALLGLENQDFALQCHFQTNRKVLIIDEFTDKNVNVTKENCNGEVSNHNVFLKAVDYQQLTHHFIDESTTIIKGKIIENLDKLQAPLAFVAIDSVDYDEVYESLQAVYQRLTPGGIILVHDYNHSWSDVHSAVDRFQATVPENFVALADMYGSVVMVKNSNVQPQG